MNIMKTFRYAAVLLAVMATVSSCYEDLGNYEYHEINEIIITPGVYSYSTPAAGQTATVTLDPAVSQTMKEDTGNLSYVWKRQGAALSWEEVGHEPTYTFEVTSSDVQTINFIFAVTDDELGITTYAEIPVNPIFKFEQCWFLLQDVNGQAVLGSVDGEGDGRVVTSDIYRQETGISLDGSPKGLGVHPYRRSLPIREYPMDPGYEILLGVFTSAKPYILNGSTLAEHSSLDYWRILYGKKASGDMSFNPQMMQGHTNGFAIIDGGRLWYAVPDELALMYEAELGQTAGGGDYYATDMNLSYGRNAQCLVLYDSQGSRFLYYSNSGLGMGYNERADIIDGGGTADDAYFNPNQANTASLTDIEEGDLPNMFNPSALPAGLVMDNMGMTQVENGVSNILATGHVGNTFHSYEMSMYSITGHTAGLSNCPNSWTVSMEGDVSSYGNGKIPVATSDYFIRLFFYAAGNTIYKVDLTSDAPVITPLWTADDTGAVITGLKMKSDTTNEDVRYGEELLPKGIAHHMGAIVRHQDGSCDLVEFNLTAAGEIEQDGSGNQSVRVFDGFTNVVDFVFSYRERI